jgi:asparagine synthase (glutamine-hydrolysing)
MVDTLPQLLRMEDRSSMAFSLEARVPLLDHRLVEYGVRLPDDLKFRNGWSKFAIRSVMQGMIPEAVRMRTTKLGFAAPDRRWLATDLRPQVDSLLAGPMRAARYVDTAKLRSAYDATRHRKASAEAYLGLFRVLAVEMWMRAFGIGG